MKSVFLCCCVLFFSTFVFSSSFSHNDITPSNQCSFLNGQNQVSGPGNILSDSQVIDNQYLVSLQRNAQLKADGTFSNWVSDVTVMDFFYRQSFSSIHTEWYDQQNADQQKLVLLQNNQTVALSISNVVLLTWNDTSATAAPVSSMVTSFALPYYPSNRQYSQVALAFHKALTAFDTKKYEESATRFFANSFTYKYPLDAGFQEPIYNAQGQVIGTQQIDETSSMIQNTVNGTVNFDANLFQVKLLPPTKALSTVLEFVVMATTQNSIKLSKYQFNTVTGATTQQWASLLLPNIADSGVILAEQPQAWNNYIRINRNPYQRDFYVIMHIHKNQQQAFKAYTQSAIVFDANKLVTPVLLRIDLSNGNIVFAQNLYEVVADELASSTTLFITNLDTLEGYVLLTGAVNPPQSLLNSNSQFNGIINTLPMDQSQKSFFIRLQFDTDRSTIISHLSKVILGHTTVQEEKTSNNVFTSLGISFALDNNVEHIVVGGYYGNTNATTDMVARGLLLQVNTTGVYLLYPMLLNDLPGTSIRHVKRSFLSYANAANYFYFAFSNGLNFAPSNGVVQKTSSNFWNLDCSSPDYQMELATTILFFVLFGIITSTLIVVVSVNLVFCVINCVKKIKSSRGAGYAKIQ